MDYGSFFRAVDGLTCGNSSLNSSLCLLPGCLNSAEQISRVFPIEHYPHVAQCVYGDGGGAAGYREGGWRLDERHTGVPAVLATGVVTVTGTIIVPAGARLISKGRSSRVIFNAGATHEVIRIEEPHLEHPVKRLFVENRNSIVPFMRI